MTDCEELIGAAYKEGGASPGDGFDCFGLVRWVVKERLGMDLPADPFGWRRHGSVIDFPCEIQSNDLLFFCRDGETVDHVGIAVSATDFLHADKKIGSVVCEPIRRHESHLKAVGRLRRDP